MIDNKVKTEMNVKCQGGGPLLYWEMVCHLAIRQAQFSAVLVCTS